MRTVEKLARSICLTRAQAAGHTAIDWRGVPMEWQTYVDIAWRLYENDAAVALAALMEPTKEMEAAITAAAWRSGSGVDPATVWRAAVKAAYSEELS